MVERGPATSGIGASMRRQAPDHDAPSAGRPADCAARTPVTTKGVEQVRSPAAALARAHRGTGPNARSGSPAAARPRPIPRAGQDQVDLLGSSPRTGAPGQPLARLEIAPTQCDVPQRPARHRGAPLASPVGHRLACADVRADPVTEPAQETIADVALITCAQWDCSIESAYRRPASIQCRGLRVVHPGDGRSPRRGTPTPPLPRSRLAPPPWPMSPTRAMPASDVAVRQRRATAILPVRDHARDR